MADYIIVKNYNPQSNNITFLLSSPRGSAKEWITDTCPEIETIAQFREWVLRVLMCTKLS